MPYSITPILMPYQNRKGLHQVTLQIIVNRMKVYKPAGIKVLSNQWKNGAIVLHPLKAKMNAIINNQKIDIEEKLLGIIDEGKTYTTDEIKEIINGKKKLTSKRFDEFTYSLIDDFTGKLSNGRIKHYRGIINKVLRFNENTTLSDINTSWLYQFENFLRKYEISNNTIGSNIKIIKAILHAAEARGLINEVNLKGYKNPKYIQPIPEYLSQEEISKLHILVKVIDKPNLKTAGYYFLLSCYAGLRLSDVKSFDYDKMVREDILILRAKKNKQVISLPIYKELAEVLEFVKANALNLSEGKIREYVKELCSLAGIKKYIKYHSSRYSAASMFLQKGFTRAEVAYLIGDSVRVSDIYAHIDNSHLKKRFKELMG